MVIDRRVRVGAVAALVMGLGWAGASLRASAVLPLAGGGESASAAAASENIVQVAAGAGQFGTLLKAAEVAGLVEALTGPGPLTVFAPTDEAFAKLDKHALASLLKPENRERLRAILLYHVVAGQVTSNDALNVASLPGSAGGVTTLNGQRAPVSLKNGGLRVGEAGVIKTDIGASNGVIHVIDTVLIPAKDDIAQTAAKAGQFKTLLAAVKAAGLAAPLKGDQPLTVFAPSDEAFAKLPAGLVEKLVKPENAEVLRSILKYHIVAGRVYADQAIRAKEAATLEGASVSVSFRNGRLRINDSAVIGADINASNGVIHIIDTVLIPPGLKLDGLAGGSSEGAGMRFSGERFTPRELIDLAIERGVPQFNGGNPEACAAIYEVTARALLATDGASGEARTALQMALEKARGTDDPAERAWSLRRGLDAARMAMAR